MKIAHEVELQMKVEAILRPRGAMSLTVLAKDFACVVRWGGLPLSGRDVSGDPLDKVGRVLALEMSVPFKEVMTKVLTWTVWICSSISFIETFPRK